MRKLRFYCNHFFVLLPYKYSFLFCLVFIYSTFSCSVRKFDIKNPTIIKKFERPQGVNYLPYYAKVYEAHEYFMKNNYEKSYAILDSLFKQNKPLNIPNYLEYGIYICSAIETGHTENLDEKLRYSIDNFASIYVFHPNRDYLLEKIFTTRSATKISKSEMDSLFTKARKKFTEKYPEEVRNQLMKMDTVDQIGMKSKDKNKIEENRIYHKKILKSLLKKYGYLSKYDTRFILHKDGFSINLITVLAHQKTRFITKQFPAMYARMVYGEIPPEEYAFLVDIVHTQEQKTCFYGTYDAFPLLYPSKINELRKKVGLPRYHYEQWCDSIEHPDSYKK